MYSALHTVRSPQPHVISYLVPGHSPVCKTDYSGQSALRGATNNNCLVLSVINAAMSVINAAMGTNGHGSSFAVRPQSAISPQSVRSPQSALIACLAQIATIVGAPLIFGHSGRIADGITALHACRCAASSRRVVLPTAWRDGFDESIERRRAPEARARRDLVQAVRLQVRCSSHSRKGTQKQVALA